VTFLNDIWDKHLTLPDRRPIWQFITEEGELPSCYAVPGKFDIELVPFGKEVLESLAKPTVRDVTAMSGVQGLKTLWGEMWLVWLIKEDPGPTQWLQPTDGEAVEHCEERFLRLIESYPIVARYFTKNRHDIQKAFIRFKHMYMRMEGIANSGNVQRKSIKNQMRSEVWQRDHWKPGKIKEASSRQTQFVHNSKSYTESQAGWIERDMDGTITGDDLYLHWLSGTQKVWSFSCLGCGKYQPYLWSHIRPDGTRAAVRWDDNTMTRRETGEWRWSELAKTIRYECIFCGHRHHDDPITRRLLNSNSKYISQNPEANGTHESFYLEPVGRPESLLVRNQDRRREKLPVGQAAIRQGQRDTFEGVLSKGHGRTMGRAEVEQLYPATHGGNHHGAARR
jgi:hypothetical protein